jgi:hypothetical protein
VPTKRTRYAARLSRDDRVDVDGGHFDQSPHERRVARNAPSTDAHGALDRIDRAV